MLCLHEYCCLSLFCKDREFYFSGKECVCVFFLLNVFKRCRKSQSTFLRSFFLNFDGQNVERVKSKHLMMIDNNKDLFWPIIFSLVLYSLCLSLSLWWKNQSAEGLKCLLQIKSTRQSLWPKTKQNLNKHFHFISL